MVKPNEKCPCKSGKKYKKCCKKKGLFTKKSAVLGNLYREGNGVKKDPKRAAELYKLAADQGHHHAQSNLASMYATGRGVIQSDQLSFKYCKLSADRQSHA